MPCRSDHLEQSEFEKQIAHVVELIHYVEQKLKLKPNRRVAANLAKKKLYFSYDEGDYFVRLLCGYLSKLSDAQRATLLKTDLKEPLSFALGKWWAEHLIADEQRKLKERAAKKLKRLQQDALAKLTPAERKALNL